MNLKPLLLSLLCLCLVYSEETTEGSARSTPGFASNVDVTPILSHGDPVVGGLNAEQQLNATDADGQNSGLMLTAVERFVWRVAKVQFCWKGRPLDGLIRDDACPHYPNVTARPIDFERVPRIVHNEKVTPFEEWAEQKLRERETVTAEAVDTNVVVAPGPSGTAPVISPNGAPVHPASTANVHVPNTAATQLRNYASKECGAKVVDANPEASNTGAVVRERDRDEYLINPCVMEGPKWAVIELCEPVQASRIDLANYELFSSSPKDFRIWGAQKYPGEWKLLGQWELADKREIQSFSPGDETKLFAKFIKVELLSHYGSEHFCPLSLVRVFGTTLVDEYEYEEVQLAPPVVMVPPVTDTIVSETPPPPKEEQENNTLLKTVANMARGLLNSATSVLRRDTDRCSESKAVCIPTCSLQRSSGDIARFCLQCPSTGRSVRRVCCLHCYYFRLFTEPRRRNVQVQPHSIATHPFMLHQESLRSRVRKNRRLIAARLPTLQTRKAQEAKPTISIETVSVFGDPMIIPTKQPVVEKATPPPPPVVPVQEHQPTKPPKARQGKAKSYKPPVVQEKKAGQGKNNTPKVQPPAAEPAAPTTGGDGGKEQTVQSKQSTPLPSQTPPQPPVVPKEQTQPTQTMQQPPSVIAGRVATPQESLFARLNGRLKTLELNISLSSQYLNELSRSYKRQMEELQTFSNRTANLLEATVSKLERETEQTRSQVSKFRSQVSIISEIVEIVKHENSYLMNEVPTCFTFQWWKWQLLIVAVEVLLLFVCLCSVVFVVYRTQPGIPSTTPSSPLTPAPLHIPSPPSPPCCPCCAHRDAPLPSKASCISSSSSTEEIEASSQASCERSIHVSRDSAFVDSPRASPVPEHSAMLDADSTESVSCASSGDSVEARVLHGQWSTLPESDQQQLILRDRRRVRRCSAELCNRPLSEE